MAQSLYIGILTLVDDFGRYDGRPRLLHGECFPLRDDVKPQQTAAALKELSACGLIQLYGFEDKEYLQILRWQERSRSDKSKFPDPPEQTAAERSGTQESASSLAIVPRHKPSSLFVVPETASAVVRERFEKWMAVRKGQGKKPLDWSDMFAEQYGWLQGFPESDRAEILSQSIRNNWQGLFPLKNGRNGTVQKEEPIRPGYTRDASGKEYKDMSSPIWENG